MKLMLSHSCNSLILLAWFVYWTILPSWDSPFLKPCKQQVWEDIGSGLSFKVYTYKYHIYTLLKVCQSSLLDGIRVEYHSKNALTKTFLPKNCNQKIDTNFTPPYDLSYKFIYAEEFTKFKHNYPRIFLRNTYLYQLPAHILVFHFCCIKPKRNTSNFGNFNLQKCNSLKKVCNRYDVISNPC